MHKLFHSPCRRWRAPPATPGVELLRLLARHPAGAIAAAMASSACRAAAAGAARALGRTGRAARSRRSSASDTDVVFLALPDTRAAELAPALRRRAASASSICPAPSACATRRAPALVSGNAGVAADVVYGLTEREREALAAARLVAYPGCYPTATLLALPPLRRGRPARAGAESSSTPSRASRAPARRRPSGRTSPSATAACRPTACSTTGTAPKSSRSSARDGHVRAAPGADRSRHSRDDLRAAAPGTDRSGGRRGVFSAAYADAPFVRLIGADAAGDQARRAHELLRHRLARRRAGARSCWCRCIDNLLKGAPGQAVQNINVMLGLDERPGCCERARTDGPDDRPQARRRAARGRRRPCSAAAAAIARLAPSGPARRRPRRRPRNRRRPEGARHRRASSTGCASPTPTRSTSSSRCWRAASTRRSWPRSAPRACAPSG